MIYPMSSLDNYTQQRNSLLETVESFGEQIMEDQATYSVSVNNIYAEYQPLYFGRPRTDETFEAEILAIGDIIYHCLIIGNSRLLHDFIIDPIEEDIRILTFSESWESYVEAFLELQNDAETATSRWYWGIVISTIEQASHSIDP